MPFPWAGRTFELIVNLRQHVQPMTYFRLANYQALLYLQNICIITQYRAQAKVLKPMSRLAHCLVLPVLPLIRHLNIKMRDRWIEPSSGIGPYAQGLV